MMFRINRKARSTSKPIIATLPVQKLKRTASLQKYGCLQQLSDTEQHWKNLLSLELNMSNLIVAFQNVDISMRMDAKKKLLLRETFMLKKQIIKLIAGQNYAELLVKLKELRDKSPTDTHLASVFIDFYEIRQRVLGGNLGFNRSTIARLKEKRAERAQRAQKQKSSIVNGRMAYILALHIIKLNGVLISAQDIAIVSHALHLKKKQLCMAGEEVNQTILESLLYVTFQFYRIIYLLKHNQELIVQYYNQIRAFISIFKTKCIGYSSYNKKFTIEQRLQNMKPLTLNLEIYDDHHRRKSLSLKNAESDLMTNHYSIKGTNNLNNHISAQIRNKSAHKIKDEHSEDSADSMLVQEPKPACNQDQEDAYFISQALSDSIEAELAKGKAKFSFQFVKSELAQLLVGLFSATIGPSYDQFDLRIVIRQHELVIGVLDIGQIPLQVQGSLSVFAKKIWRTVKDRFYTDKNQFLPSLFSYDYPPLKQIPQDINEEHELPILVRTHEILLHYLRKNGKVRKMNGWIVRFPSIKSEQLKESKQTKLAEDKVFNKRLGFIAHNSNLNKLKLTKQNSRDLSRANPYRNQPELHSYVKVLLLIRQESQILYVYLQWSGKKTRQFTLQIGLDIFNNNPTVLRNRICEANEIKWGPFFSSRPKRIRQFIQRTCRKYEVIIDNSHARVKSYNRQKEKGRNAIQEEFEVMKRPILQIKNNQIKIYRQKREVRVLPNKPNLKFIFKINNKFTIFHQETYRQIKRYYNNRTSFYICKQNQQDEIVYLKFRLYKVIVFRGRNNQSQFCRIYPSKPGIEGISVQRQQIRSSFVRTYIIRCCFVFFMVNIYQHEQPELFVYNLYDTKTGMLFFGISPQLQTPCSIDPESLQLNGSIQMEAFTQRRDAISDVQEYVDMKLRHDC